MAFERARISVDTGLAFQRDRVKQVFCCVVIFQPMLLSYNNNA